MKKKEEKLKFYTVEQTYAKASKSKQFQKTYKEELARLLLAQEIRQLRKDRKLTQAAVAKKINKPQSVVARLESGKHSCTLETLQQIAAVFDKKVRLV